MMNSTLRSKATSVTNPQPSNLNTKVNNQELLDQEEGPCRKFM